MNVQIELPERRFRDALHSHARVVHALMLRDIKTRFGASYFGFLFGLFMPVAHIGIIVMVFIVLGRKAPIGTDGPVYLATAVVPFIIWSYTHQKVMQGFLYNRSLTSFPIVKFTDIGIARALVELMNAVLIVSVVATVLLLSGHDLFIADPPSAFYGLILAYAYGAGTGAVFGLLALLAPAFMVLGFVTIPLFWVTCGVFFIPEALPEIARSFISYFPISHIVDFVREAYFSDYTSDYYSLLYVHAVILALIVTVLMMERFLRPSLTSK